MLHLPNVNFFLAQTMTVHYIKTPTPTKAPRTELTMVSRLQAIYARAVWPSIRSSAVNNMVARLIEDDRLSNNQRHRP